jgi:RNA polymerase sigma factor (sigma-70 family)
MSNRVSAEFVRSLRRIFGRSPSDGLGDAELLGRFVATRDEEAFELLLWRYAALVLNVCRQVLRDEQAAEDAFQATFLVLIRRAKTISRRETLPAWLYRVAHRIALRARERLVQEKGRHQPGFDLDQVPGIAAEILVDADLSRMLHEEVGHLPARYRVPVVCCYLQGQTYAEAAERLGWREGTVAGRLARARELLRKRLAQRGVCLAVAAVTTHLTASACEAARWTRHVTHLLRGLRAVASNDPIAAGLSARAAELATGVISQMFWTKLKTTAVVLLAALGAVGLGAGVTARHFAEKPEAPAVRAERPPEAEKKPDDAPPEAADPTDEAMRRLRLRRNFKTVALAIHNYNATYGHLPLPALSSKDGKPLLSWRVALLPYIDQDALYKRFKLDEAWDSPHNKPLGETMLAIYGTGLVGEKSNRTTIQYLVGPGAIFPSQVIRGGAGGRGGFPGGGGPMGGPGGPGAPGGPPGMMGPGGGMGSGLPSIPNSIPDGTSNTLLLVEARTPVPWTKPEDVPYDARKPLPALGSTAGRVFHVAFADGSVRALSQRVDPMTLRALISPNGGEVIDHKKFALEAQAGGHARQEALAKLEARKQQLQQEIASLREIMTELKQEMLELRWTAEKEKLLALDPAAVKLKKENEEAEKVLKETRDDVRKLFADLAAMKKELQKKPK